MKRIVLLSLAMAEIVHQAGYAAVILDSIFHWEYVRLANRGILPGCLTEDRKRLAEFLSRILDDLRADGRIADISTRRHFATSF